MSREAEVRLWALADTHVETGATVVGAELACVALMELSASRALVLGVRVNPRRTRVNPFVSPSPGYCFLSFQGASLLISATLTWHPPISSLRSPLFTCPSRELIFHHYVFLPLLYSQRGRAVRCCARTRWRWKRRSGAPRWQRHCNAPAETPLCSANSLTQTCPPCKINKHDL